MSLIVDASVILKWVIPEADSDLAEALFDVDEVLTAPSLWRVETANALWRLAGRGEIDADEAAVRYARLQRAPLLTIPFDDHLPDALQLSLQLRHPVYDCVYLSAAIREGACLITADQRFARAADRAGLADRVRLLGA